MPSLAPRSGRRRRCCCFCSWHRCCRIRCPCRMRPWGRRREEEPPVGWRLAAGAGWRGRRRSPGSARRRRRRMSRRGACSSWAPSWGRRAGCAAAPALGRGPAGEWASWWGGGRPRPHPRTPLTLRRSAGDSAPGRRGKRARPGSGGGRGTGSGRNAGAQGGPVWRKSLRPFGVRVGGGFPSLIWTWRPACYRRRRRRRPGSYLRHHCCCCCA